MNANQPTNREANATERYSLEPFSNRRWSLVLFLAVLVGLAQFGLGQFSPWVIAAPFVALLLGDLEGAWSKGHGAGGMERGVLVGVPSRAMRDGSSNTEPAKAGTPTKSGMLAHSATAFVFHGVLIGAVMTAVGDAGHDSGGGRFVMANGNGILANSATGGCGSGGMCGGGQAAVGTLASSATAKSAGGCGSGGCGSSAGGGCGSGGTVAGNQTLASSATGKSACGCGGGASSASNPRAVAVNVPPQQQPQIGMVPALQNGILANSATGMLARPAMGSAMPPPVRVMSNQPVVTNPGGRVPGVMNTPLSSQVHGQSPTSTDRPAHRGTGLQNARQPQPDLATAIQRAASLPGPKTVPAMPPPLIAAPAANPPATTPPVAKTEDGLSKKTLAACRA